MPPKREHNVSIVVGGRQIDHWTEYQIDTSLVEPAQTFSLRRSFDRFAWDACPRDARVRVLIDDAPRIVGFVDRRAWNPKAGTMEIAGRCGGGRLVDESIPRASVGGATMLTVVEQAASPWFRTVTLTNARNRRVTLGKGSKTPSESGALALLKGRRSTAKASKGPIAAMFAKPGKNKNRIDPGQPRWEVIQQILSQAGLIAWSTADGQTLFVGTPDHDQPALFSIRHSKTRHAGLATEIDYEESNEGRYSAVFAVGAGNNSSADYGNVSRSGSVFDHPSNTVDGTGRDFLHPKRLVLGERALSDNDEASRLAGREQAKRDFRRTHLTVTMPHHGQLIAGVTRTLFAVDTIAHVVLEDDHGIAIVDGDFLIYSASFKATRDAGETTTLELVPRGTRILAA